MNKFIFSFIFLATQPAAWATPENREYKSLIQDHCPILLGDEIEKSLVSHEIITLGTEDKKYTLFNLKIKIKINKKTSYAEIKIGCYSDNKARPSKDPKEELKQEDSGGRYYHNIAWQRKIHGNNWEGLIAFSDYLFGDGRKIPTYNYNICPAKLPCFSYEIETRPSLTPKERDSAIEIIKKIRYTHHQ